MSSALRWGMLSSHTHPTCHMGAQWVATRQDIEYTHLARPCGALQHGRLASTECTDCSRHHHELRPEQKTTRRVKSRCVRTSMLRPQRVVCSCLIHPICSKQPACYNTYGYGLKGKLTDTPPIMSSFRGAAPAMVCGLDSVQRNTVHTHTSLFPRLRPAQTCMNSTTSVLHAGRPQHMILLMSTFLTLTAAWEERQNFRPCTFYLVRVCPCNHRHMNAMYMQRYVTIECRCNFQYVQRLCTRLGSGGPSTKQIVHLSPLCGEQHVERAPTHVGAYR